MKTETHRSLLSITFCVLLLFLLPASLAFAEGNSESTTFTIQIDDHGIMTLEGNNKRIKLRLKGMSPAIYRAHYYREINN